MADAPTVIREAPESLFLTKPTAPKADAHPDYIHAMRRLAELIDRENAERFEHFNHLKLSGQTKALNGAELAAIVMEERLRKNADGAFEREYQRRVNAVEQASGHGTRRLIRGITSNIIRAAGIGGGIALFATFAASSIVWALVGLGAAPIAGFILGPAAGGLVSSWFNRLSTYRPYGAPALNRIPRTGDPTSHDYVEDAIFESPKLTPNRQMQDLVESARSFSTNVTRGPIGAGDHDYLKAMLQSLNESAHSNDSIHHTSPVRPVARSAASKSNSP